MKSKIVIIGAGNVGSILGFSIINQGLCNELIFIDLNYEKVVGEVLDLQHANTFMERKTVIRAGDYQDCADADIVVITASAPMKPDEDDRLDMLSASKNIIKAIVPSVMKYGFRGIMLVVSNPVDIMTYYAWKLSGLPARQVLGSGTVLDTARLTCRLSQMYDINAKSIDVNVIGEHGDTETIVWNTATIGGKSLKRVMKDNEQRTNNITREQIKNDVMAAGWEIFHRKGNTSYGIAASVSRIIKSIVFDEDRIYPVSVYLDGIYGLRDVYLSLPAVINREGLREIVELDLTDSEMQGLFESYKILKEKIQTL